MKAKKISKKILAILLSLYTIWSICYAFTTNVGDYKKGDYRAIQKVASKNDYVYAEKSAYWNDDESSEATVKIVVETKKKTVTTEVPGQPEPPTELPSLNNADIIFVMDTSKSSYNRTTSGSKAAIERNVILPAAKSLITGDYANAGNRIAFCEFAQRIFLYSNKSGKNSPVAASGFGYTGTYSVSNRRRSVSESDYTSAYNAMSSSINGSSAATFYTKASDIENVINNAANTTLDSNHTDSNARYTNLDTFLIYANYLKNNYGSGRKMYLIVFSDGCPDPIAIKRQSNNNIDMSLDGIRSTGSYGSNPGDGPGKNHNREWLLSLSYPFNMLYKIASDKFRSGGNEIFFVKTGEDTDYAGSIYPIWNYITEKVSIPSSLTGERVDLPKDIENAKKSDPNCFRTNTDHIKTLSSGTSDSAISSIINKIYEYIGGSTTQTPGTPTPTTETKVEPVAFSCKVTDVINYDLFDIVPNSWNSNVNKSKISYDSKTKTITWPISGLNYGDKASNGKWPTLTFKIKLKSKETTGWLNTNYIKTKDDSCKITETPDPTNENFTVPSPWLNRNFTGRVIERYILVTGKGIYTALDTKDHKDVSKGSHSYAADLSNYKRYKYIGNKVEEGLTSSYQFDPGETYSSTTPSITISYEKRNYVITHVFVNPPDFGVEFLHYDKSEQKYITPTDTVVRKYDSLLSLGKKWFDGNQTAIDKYFEIMNGSGTEASKLNQLIDMASDKWNGDDFKALKSLYTENYVNGRLSYCPGELDLRINSGSPVKLSDQITSNNVQYIPTLASVKSAITSLASQVKDGCKIKVTFYYERRRFVTVNHLDVDNESFKVSPTTTDYIKVGDTKTYNALSGHILDNGSSYYTFYNKNRVNSYEGTSNTGINGTSSSVKVTADLNNFLKDVNIDFLYKKWWKVSVYYKDIDDSSDILNPVYYYKQHNDPLTEDYIDLVNKDGLHYRYKYVDAKMGETVLKTQSPDKQVKIDHVTNTVEIIFWYRKLPSITTTVIPETEFELGDPDDPSNPFTHKPTDDFDIIVLDDLFSVKMDIDHYSYGETGSTVKISFPFDVYAMEGAVNERPATGKFYKAGTEILVDDFDPAPTEETKSFTYTFRLPSWVVEQIYNGASIDKCCHTVIYGPYDDESNPGHKEVIDEKWKNIRVIGRVYDFTVTNLEGDDKWLNSLFGGTNKGKEYKADTLPIGQSLVNSKNSTLPNNTNNIRTQDPTWKYGMKLGSKFYFSINTKGLLSDQVEIVPKLVYYDAQGNLKNNVVYTYKLAGKGEVLYAGTDGLATNDVANNTKQFTTQLTNNKRFNTELQQENAKSNALKAYYTNNTSNLYITPITAENRKYSVSLLNAYKGYMQGATAQFGTYKTLTLPNTLRLSYANYASDNTTLSEVQKIGVTRISEQNGVLKYVTTNNSEYRDKINSSSNGTASVSLTEDQIINSLGHWYAEYKLPATLTVRENNVSGNELKSGYIVVEFKIYTKALDGGKYWKYLSYSSQLRGGKVDYNQWYLENTAMANKDSSVAVNFPQTSANSTGFTRQLSTTAGYYPVAVYDASMSVNDDYEPVVTH